MQDSGHSRVGDATPSAAVAAARVVLAEAVTMYADEFAIAIGAFLLAAGVDRERGARALEQAAASVRRGEVALPAAEREPWIQLSDAIALWWRDPQYVDESGRPRPLPDTGPAPSLEDLFGRTIAPAMHGRARDLLRRKAARVHHELWHYTGEYAVLRLGREEAVHRLLTELSGWMRTFLYNQVLVDEPAHRRNFDGSTHVSGFPESRVPELQAKLYRRMQLVLEEFDSYMTAAASRGHQGPVVRVGVTAFMHTSPLTSELRSDQASDLDRSAQPAASAQECSPAPR